ncbi:MAG: bifunctional UDP-3-O-[3-hydroxymyristoyl] N-acetylglucosamine deacetylase/3-hydroxyacyl-ACP dehydratase [Chlorobi bacterium]|nr:bifunctional UDP-3-O-[3-hydroxymyristoyl] N-acetylglucosamine deacetylase/3-hydroxyacyl-ACP dehydratase [Chlorobiota bacterium]
MVEKQKTLKNPISVNGKGLHTGIDVTLTFKPAPENHGYKFQRIDLKEKPIIRAIVENVVDTSRGTTVEEHGARISTVEHALSALYGLGIDNALLEINGPEVPIMDGSAKLFVEAILKAGIAEQKENKKYYVVKEKMVYTNEIDGVELIAFPDDHFSLNVLIDYDSHELKNQFATLNTIKNFEHDIAPCRTFVFLRELEALLKNNLIKGGDLNNAIVIVDRKVSQKELDRLADLFQKPKVKVKPEGVLNNLDLFFSNEPARHKLLDMIGDLSLIGRPIIGRVIATRPGHHANTEFAKKLKLSIKNNHDKNLVPVYDPSKEPALNIKQIEKILPHRNPFLLVDKIIEIGDDYIIGLKNVTMNEGFFVGHFPNDPIMPGVLQVEAMAQTGGVLVLSTVPDPENYSTYFLKIDNVRFKRKVVPGDTLLFRLELMSPIRRGIAQMKAQAFVGNNLVTEAELMAQVVKDKI